MNGDDPSHSADHADLEARLRGWRPTDLPPALQARLRSARPPRMGLRTVPPKAGALAWGLAAAACVAWLAFRLGGPGGPGNDPAPGGSPASRRAPEPASFAETHWTPGERLTMNLATGLSPGVMPITWLDGDRAELSDLILVRSADGNLPLKVDCHF